MCGHAWHDRMPVVGAPAGVCIIYNVNEYLHFIFKITEDASEKS